MLGATLTQPPHNGTDEKRLIRVAQQRSDTFEVVKPAFGLKTYFGYVARKDDDSAKLMDAITTAMLKIKGDGRLAKIQKKWFGDSFDTPDAVTNPAL